MDCVVTKGSERGGAGRDPGQPFETAPKESRYFLAYDPEHLNIYSVNWWQGAWHEAGASYPLNRQLTHWRPLPASPGSKS